MRRGVLAKDTHGSTIRLAPPLVIERDDLEWAMDQLVAELGTPRAAARRSAPRASPVAAATPWASFAAFAPRPAPRLIRSGTRP